MKKLITIISLSITPLISLAQSHYYKYDLNTMPIWAIFFMMLIPIILFAISILAFVFWILMLIDAIKHSPEKTKIVWVLVIIFTQIIGALIYYFAEKKERDEKKKIKIVEIKEEGK